MIDFSPNLRQAEPETPLMSPTSPRTPLMSPPPMNRRRSSENAMQRRASMSDYRNAQARMAKVQTAKEAIPTEATIRGVSLPKCICMPPEIPKVAGESADGNSTIFTR